MRDPLSSLLIRSFAPDTLADSQQRVRMSLLEGYTSVAVNVVLFVTKLAIGVLSGSIALLADAIHTLADSATSVVVIVSAYVARRPADREHPFGHGRAELIAALIVAVLLGVAALEFGKASVGRLLDPQLLIVPWWATVAVAVTAGVKQWLSHFALALARTTGNKALEADAWHHSSDVFATLLVVVAMIASRYGLAWADGTMGLLVSAVIAFAAYRIAAGSISPLLGEAPSEAEIQDIGRRAVSCDGVRGAHDIIVHRYGELRVVSLHIETSEQLSARDSHQLAEAVQARITDNCADMVVVHVDPINDHHPHYDEVGRIIAAIVAQDEALASYHDLRLVGDDERFNVVVDLAVRQELDRRRRVQVVQAIENALRRRFPNAQAAVYFEPSFAYSAGARPASP